MLSFVRYLSKKQTSISLHAVESTVHPNDSQGEPTHPKIRRVGSYCSVRREGTNNTQAERAKFESFSQPPLTTELATMTGTMVVKVPPTAAGRSISYSFGKKIKTIIFMIHDHP